MKNTVIIIEQCKKKSNSCCCYKGKVPYLNMIFLVPYNIILFFSKITSYARSMLRYLVRVYTY